ncbi:MAG: hypothetical protein FJ100_07675 [Deltaproteobacteria bacterium]|nr:hypothetical protein [Deltaproteobacteria bacterium]
MSAGRCARLRHKLAWWAWLAGCTSPCDAIVARACDPKLGDAPTCAQLRAQVERGSASEAQCTAAAAYLRGLDRR